MLNRRFPSLCAGVFACLIAGPAQAQIGPRGEPKEPDWIKQMQKDGQDAFKRQQEMMQKLQEQAERQNQWLKDSQNQRFGAGFKPPAGQPSGDTPSPFATPPAAAPERQYNPRARPSKAASTPASTLGPPLAQPALAERAPPPAAAAPAKPPCVYKPVMTDDDIAACR